MKSGILTNNIRGKVQQMLIVKFNGGLGNQLFQYAFYEYLKLNNKDVYADISDFSYHRHHNGYEIEKVFQCNIEKAGKKAIYRLAINHNSLLIKIIEKFFRIKVCKNSEYNEINRISLIQFVPIKYNIYFAGYWQNVHYINMTQAILKEKLIFNYGLQGKNLEYYEHFKERETVSVHIRRADYLDKRNVAAFGEICTKKYYEEAIKYMKKKLRNPVFVFFSDDITWCKDEFGEYSENYYIDWNIGKDSYKDMQLMSLCKHNIIANSTFSWWGAWLNNNEEKIVIMPKQWTAFSDSTGMDPGWVRM